MPTVNPNRAGLVLGTAIGGFHVVWALLVAFGWAQAALDFVFWIHFLTPAYSVTPFVAARAVLLIAVTATIGYVIGYTLAAVWNWIHR